ncbi:carbohydrate ABC transporter permease [Lapidilactobacillus wuchangensis]|uniref:carbohydrate ABC transporter permease n=1 Tax=Lapidilactobacillus wuchangensis TaxID=2486001 RepID=UPI001CDB5554|nr:sugar ABC transporter permease [Lapidilactobacillus wuchangensis]
MKKKKGLAPYLSIIPGLGQFYNGQIAKGIVFLALFIIMVVELALFGVSSLISLVTLGTVPFQDNSLFLMIKGTMQLIITVVFVMFYVMNIVDASHTAKKVERGEKIPISWGEFMHSIGDSGFPYLLSTPAYLLMLFTIVFPALVTLFMAFTNYGFLNNPPAHLLKWVGFKNFFSMFMLSGYKQTFLTVFGWTIVWTLCATTLQIFLGIMTAVVLNQDYIKFKRIFGVIFLLPWAIPSFISIMSFSNIFNDSAGAMNVQVLGLLNHIPGVSIPPIAWLTDPMWTKVAIILIQGWLGFPYVYVLVTGILQSIPNELYEAATMDGATVLQKFNHITFPMILAVASPFFVTQYTFNFNNFSMIYLFNNGGPGDVGGGAGGTDILISWIYKLTTGSAPQYSIAAALTLLISVIIISISLIVFKKTKAFDLEG